MPEAFAAVAWPTASWHGRPSFPDVGVYHERVDVALPLASRFIGCAVAPPSPKKTMIFFASGRPRVRSSSAAASTAGAIGVQNLDLTHESVERSWLVSLRAPFASLKSLRSGATTHESCDAAVPSMK